VYQSYRESLDSKPDFVRIYEHKVRGRHIHQYSRDKTALQI